MKPIKNSLIASVGVIAVAGLVTFFIPALTQGQKTDSGTRQPPATQDVRVVNTSSQPVPVAGSVSVENVVQFQPAIPSRAFSVTTDGGLISGPDPAGTSYAITGFTVANTSGTVVVANLAATWGTTSDCVSFSGSSETTGGLVVSVSVGQTVHISLSQPFVLSSRPGAAGCLQTAEGGGNAVLTVVGYRL